LTEGAPANPGPRVVRLRLTTVVLMIFVFVSSGAYGIEDMISSSGPGMALLLLVVLPFLWSNPMALVCAELGSALPSEGGFYEWVRRALGEFWGFQCGWWWVLTGFVDTAVYVVLTVDYIETFLPLSPLEQWLLSLVIIIVFTVVNIRGLNLVAIGSVAFSVIILLPFVALVVLGFVHWQHSPVSPFVAPGQSWLGSMGLGLAIGMWMYSGYESMSTVAGEIERPRRMIPRALLIAVPIVILSYILPTLAGLAGAGRWQDWATDDLSFVEAGRIIGGAALATALLVSAIVSNLALYMDYLCANARPMMVMAQQGLLPRALERTHRRWGTPWVSILVTAVLTAVCTLGPFQTLIVIDVFLYMFSLVLILVAAVVLRVKEPELERPYRVPFGTWGLALLCTPPVVIAVIALVTNGWSWFLGGCVGALSGPLAYLLVKPGQPRRLRAGGRRGSATGG
jgi:amino acid transporter